MTPSRRIPVVTRILDANDRVAAENRRDFAARGLKVINLISSPGAGKTALLEHTLPALRDRAPSAVIVGDIATTRDAERLAARDIPVVQITTESFGGSCHLEAATIRQAMEGLDLTDTRLLVVENVGNLVCPAEFDVGEQAKVVLLSVTEGEDKPLKYPLAFQVASVALVTKVDLLPHLDFNLDILRANIQRVNPNIQVFEISVRTGQGMEPWMAWLDALLGEEA